MSTRTLRLAAILLGGLAATPVLAQTATTPTPASPAATATAQPRRFAIFVGGGESQQVIYVDANMAPRTAVAGAPAPLPMGPLEAVTIGYGESAMTVYVDNMGRMAMQQSALRSAPAAIGQRQAVYLGGGESAMVVYVQEVEMTPARR
ncbi:hypothetical protein [Neoroseomonas soli]|uniref:hypothetical protein n=1 Tax=Neoroseomonas soli TaxID=1081025 RepID=UPI001FEA1DAA|nr:hypothetical protein [Neoroseomonas soli]